jgi:4a-hydroxytetrahydrobiopterin dehydratase
MRVLSQEEITQKLEALPGWQFTVEGLQKQFVLKGFMDAIVLVNRVAEAAESVNHHPDILVNYDRVTFTLITHDARGITQRDFDLAARIEALAS